MFTSRNRTTTTVLARQIMESFYLIFSLSNIIHVLVSDTKKIHKTADGGLHRFNNATAVTIDAALNVSHE